MTQVSKNDVNQIFASNAPDQDKPPSFENYTTGWGVSRSNNGKPTIKGFNFLQQRTDQNLLWIHQNGGALPYDASIEYADGAIVLKDGRISKLVNDSWVDVLKSENEKALPPYYDSSITYQVGSRIMLDDNSGFVVSNIANNTNNPNNTSTGWSILRSVDSVSSLNELSNSIKYVNKIAYIKGDGHYYYDGKDWVKDQTLNIYDFKSQQYIAYYYNIYKDWDEAIFQAQLAIYTKNLSSKLVLPSGIIKINRPILHGAALGDYINERYPELEFYNSSTQQYKKTWSLIIEGVNNSFRDGVDNPDQTSDSIGTQIVFCGCKDDKDKNFMNKAVIYSGNTNYLDNRKYDSAWADTWADIRNINIDCNNQDGSKFGMIHGIYLYHGNHVYLEKIVVYRVWGGGIICDLTYDSRIVECKILRCGRMMGSFSEYMTNPKNDIAYQTYAPLHIMNSDVNVGRDDSNFIRVIDCQIEDSAFVVADVIVSDASPTWFSRNHFECEAGIGPISSGKTVFCLGKWGVRYFGRDSEADFVGNEDTGVGGSAIIEGGSMFSQCYSDLALVHRFSNIAIDKWLDPQTANLVIDGGNASVNAVVSNSTLASVTVGGGLANTYPLRMTNTKLFGDLSFDYVGSSIVDNVIIEGNLSFKNTATEASRKNPFKLDVVVKGKVTGYPQYATGRINTQSVNGFYPYSTDIYLNNIDEYNDLIGAK